MIGFYIFQFSHNGLSEYTTDWANFGAYFGSITGLLAFAGVLYSINESKKQTAENEERAIFFKMIDLYHNKLDTILKIEVKPGEPLVGIGDIIIEHTIIAIIYDHILDNDQAKIASELIEYNDVVKEIALTLGVNPDELNYEYLQAAIRFNVSIKMITVPRKLLKADNLLYLKYADWVTTILLRKENSEYYLYCFKIINFTSNYLIRLYGHLIGQYMRNIINVLEFSHNSNKSSYYGRFFMSQISSPELILIFYYALSKEGSLDFINYSREFELFQNFELAYLLFFLARKEGITEPDKTEKFIEEVLKIYEYKKKYRLV